VTRLYLTLRRTRPLLLLVRNRLSATLLGLIDDRLVYALLRLVSNRSRNNRRWTNTRVRGKRMIHRHNRRSSVIDRCKIPAIRSRRLHMLLLRRHRWRMLLVQSREFRPLRSRLNPSGPVVAHPVIVGVVVDSVVVNIVNNRRVYIVDRPVIVKSGSVPIATLVPEPHITKTVIYAAVVANMATPISAVIPIPAAFVPPVSGRPQRSLVRCRYPSAWHPVVAIRRIVPIAGRPNIPVAGAWRLVILRQLRRRLRRIFDRLIRGIIV